MSKFRNSAEGSITVEAAIVLPIILLILISFIHTVIKFEYEHALQTTVSNSVQVIAANFYPIHTLQEKSQLHSSLKYGVAPFVRFMTPKGLLNSERLLVTQVQYPDFTTANRSFLKIEVAYRLPFRMPFSNKPWIIRKSAVERVWVGSNPASLGIIPKEVQIVSVLPSPVSRGSVAKIRAKAPKGEKADIQITYKTGLSIAKGLQPQIIGANGLAEWSWHVGGNTTPGLWKIQVSAAGHKDFAFFEVIKK